MKGLAVGALVIGAVTSFVLVDAVTGDWDPSAPGQIIGVMTNGPTAFDNVGRAWRIVGAQWSRPEELDFPVEISSVRCLEGNVLLTDSDEAWQVILGSWTFVGPFPGGAIATEKQSWGRVKAGSLGGRNPLDGPI